MYGECHREYGIVGKSYYFPGHSMFAKNKSKGSCVFVFPLSLPQCWTWKTPCKPLLNKWNGIRVPAKDSPCLTVDRPLNVSRPCPLTSEMGNAPKCCANMWTAYLTGRKNFLIPKEWTHHNHIFAFNLEIGLKLVLFFYFKFILGTVLLILPWVGFQFNSILHKLVLVSNNLCVCIYCSGMAEVGP